MPRISLYFKRVNRRGLSKMFLRERVFCTLHNVSLPGVCQEERRRRVVSIEIIL